MPEAVRREEGACLNRYVTDPAAAGLEAYAQIWHLARAWKNSQLTGGQFDNIRLIVDNAG
jgi:hypothetical protein